MNTRAAAALAMLLPACAGPLALGTPKAVHGVRVPPREMHEECFAMARGQSVTWRFNSDAAVDFAVQFRDGEAIVLPYARERVTADEGRFAALAGTRYCLTWEAGGRGAALDYALELLPAVR